MRVIKNIFAVKLIVTFVLFCMLAQQTMQVHAQAAAVVRPFTGALNRAIGGVIEKQLLRRGFAANDPLIAKTMTRAGGSVDTLINGGTIALTAAGIAGAPVWVSVAIGLTVLSIAAAGFGWLYYNLNKDNSGNFVLGKAQGVPDFSQIKQWVEARTPACATGAGGYQCFYEPCDTDATRTHCGTAPLGSPSYTIMVPDGNGGLMPSAGQVYTQAAEPNSYPVAKSANIGDVYQAITPTQLAAKLDDETLASLARAVINQATSVYGYDGAPFDYTDPITAADAHTWALENPTGYPTVSDLFSPTHESATAANPNTITIISPGYHPTVSNPPLPDPISNPQTITTGNVPGTNTNPAKIDLGPDPAIGEPTLETLPTIATILDPIFNLMPSLKNYVVPAHTSTCPTGTFTVFNQQITMDSQCTIANQIAPTMQNIMTAAFIVVALFIVLSA